MTIPKAVRISAVAVALASAVGVASAATIVKDVTNPVTIPGFSAFTVTGGQMAGMSVTATFSGGTSSTKNWIAFNATSGGVTGDDWTLTQSGNTFGGSWIFNLLTGNFGTLVSLELDGAPGLTVFDTSTPAPGTDGSENGLDFSITSSTTLNAAATATYSRAIQLPSANPVGDTFHLLTITFGSVDPGRNFTFTQDTDNDIRATIPEPGTLALLGLGLAGLAATRRRKQ